ncbi:MAG: hypothetical protein DRP64_07620, partial [Verrucomicrobia bacterium]
GEKTATKSLWVDYQRGNRPDVPGFLKKFSPEQGRQDVGDTNVPPASSKLRPVPPTSSRLRPVPPASSGLPRQSRHQADL